MLAALRKIDVSGIFARNRTSVSEMLMYAFAKEA
jgi:hypothetical protein